MILFLIFLGLCILLIIDVFRYNKAKANAFSEYELKKAAYEEVKKLEYSDPFITCEYCGAKIDTHIDKCCSHCGAPYDLNHDWIERHQLKDSFIKEGTDAVNEKREKKAIVMKSEIMGRIRKEITILIVMMASFLLMAAFGYYLYDQHKYKSNENVNTNSYQNFVVADYTVKGDSVIYNKDGVIITVTGIYEDESADNASSTEGKHAAKVGFRVQNGLGKNIYLVLKCCGVNGVFRQRGFIYAYDYFRKNADVTYYEELWHDSGNDLSELIFDYIEVGAIDYTYTGRLDIPSYIHTTAPEASDIKDLSDMPRLYSNGNLDVFGIFNDEDYLSGYKLYIRNNSDKNYYIDDLEFRVDGSVVKSEKILNGLLPAGYIYETDRIRSYEVDDELLKTKKCEVALSFVDKEEHLDDFSTGFMDLSGLIKVS
ncbi:hypothetical protein [Oribacterium sp. WCC10]|uniref:hypothetical protein n=1 Tax=Oribacterium sp. WCC10 TaxID=1855343 RepID=UPI0008F1857B|nr:hypothetical protein [Oribacterium sp. WCC10]SFG43015.1 hypothetical protein SAMN05216356_10890 [Oribacterium sp. WCC10]